MDFEIIEARDGHDGIEKAKTEYPIFNFLHIQLPVMDGVIDTANKQELKKTWTRKIIE